MCREGGGGLVIFHLNKKVLNLNKFVLIKSNYDEKKMSKFKIYNFITYSYQMRKDKDADKTDKMDVIILFNDSLNNSWREKNSSKPEWKILKIHSFQVISSIKP